MSTTAFVLALVAIVGGLLVLLAAVVGVIVVVLVDRLDHLVNGWQGRRDDDGDDGGERVDPPPPPPDDPPQAPDPQDRPRHRELLNTARGWARGGGSGGPPGVVAAPVVSPAAQRTAARLAANLRQLVGVDRAELLAVYADPVPGHEPTCVCPGCVHRLVEWYAAATADSAIAYARAAAGPDGEEAGS